MYKGIVATMILGFVVMFFKNRTLGAAAMGFMAKGEGPYIFPPV